MDMFNNNINNNAILFAYLNDVEDFVRNNMRVERRMLRDTTNPFEVPDYKFLKDFRLQKVTVQFLIQELEPHVLVPKRADSIPFFLKVLCTLHFYANGSDQNCAGNSAWTNMSQPVTSRAINLISRLITNHVAHRYIKFPTSANEKLSIKEGFYNKWGIRGAIGAIDGTHVEIIKPPITDREHQPHLYMNRKGKFSINVMLVCDSDCNILAVNARFPGSVHDAAIWHTSQLRAQMKQNYEAGDINSYLIGDSGYGNEPWLFTPYNNVIEGSPQARFNELHRRSRNVIERTNGVIKSRFRCLSKFRLLQYHPTTAAFIIYSCAVLHNLAMKTGIGEIEFNEDEIDENEANIPGYIVDNDVAHRGRDARDNYVQQNFV